MNQRRIALLALLVNAAIATAQTRPVTITGIVFDSLRNKPLADAFVSMSGTNRSTTSDASGVFRFADVAPGTYVFTMQHDVFDSLGVSGSSARVTIRDERDTVRLSVPSFGTFWRAACPGIAPRDSGVVYGTVRDASGNNAIPRANVEVTWTDIASTGPTSLKQSQRRGSIRADTTGRYALCGVPLSTALHLRSSLDGLASGGVDLLPLTMPVRRVDFRIAPVDQKTRGTVAGTVVANGRPISAARVVIGDLPEIRTDNDGRFIARNVPAGTQTIEASAIGVSPGSATLDVTPGDTTRVQIELGKVVALPGVNVNATPARAAMVREFESRRKLGLGVYRDSSQLAKYHTFLDAFNDMSGAIAVRGGIGQRKIQIYSQDAAVLINGVQVQQSDMALYDQRDIAAVEVYTAPSTIPMELRSRIRRSGAGLVVIWTKSAFP
jgi:hypothetical protein